MSANSIREENGEEHKQVGCMNGILKLLQGGPNTKRPPSGKISKKVMEIKTESEEEAMEKNQKIIEKEEEDTVCVKTAEPEPSSVCQSIFFKTPSQKQSTIAPRSSYDGRESKDSLKAALNFKELPRLSLDSRDSESRIHYLLTDLQEEPGSNKKPSSIVAKLMGLEDFPEPISTKEGQIVKSKSLAILDLNTSSSRTSRILNESMQSQVCASSRMRNDHSLINPITKKRLENKKEEQDFTFGFQGSKRREDHSDYPISPSMRFESPVVIIKPAKFMENRIILGSSMKTNDGMPSPHKLKNGVSPYRRKGFVYKQKAENTTQKADQFRNTSTLPLCSRAEKSNRMHSRSMQASNVSQHTIGESPRLQEKMHVTWKQSRTRQSSKRKLESSLPGRKLKPIYTNLSHQGDTISMQSEDNITLTSEVDVEVTSLDHSKKKRGKYYQDGPKDKNPATSLLQCRSLADCDILEKPCPVAVLDAIFYGEDSTSHVKRISTTFKDDETLNPNEAGQQLNDLNQLLMNNKGPNLDSDFNHKKSNDKIGRSKFKDKAQRERSLDVVNEIFGVITSKESPKLGKRSSSGEKILKEFCSVIDYCQSNSDCSIEYETDELRRILSSDMENKLNDEEHNKGEVPVVVLDIEHLIFRDLISEVCTLGDS